MTKVSTVINVSESGFVDIEHFKDFIDISRVSYYNLKQNGDIITLTFYDSKKKLIKPYMESKNVKQNKKGKKTKSKARKAKE
jgi:hypothetical protein